MVDRLESQGKKFDYAVVSAATFPDWTKPLQNEDGIHKSFAIAVIGRFLIYRNMYRFMNPDSRILNVLASGSKLPTVRMFHKDVATGKRNVSSLIDAIMNFAVGNEIMIDSLFKRDTYFRGKKMFTMVSTHPGMIKTDLHNGQGLAFSILEDIMVKLIGITEHTCE